MLFHLLLLLHAVLSMKVTHHTYELFMPNIRSNVIIGDRYLLGKILSQGKLGIVYEARDLNRNEFIIKAIHDSPFSQDPRKEVQALSDLQGHANICKLYEVIKYPNYWLLVMQKYKGDLYQLRKMYNINEADVISIFDRLYSAIKHMHKKGYAHRDIKLENIFYSLDPFEIYLGDFGLITKEQVSHSRCGTTGKQSPECILRGPYDTEKNDVWSLAVTLMELVSGANINFDRYYIPKVDYNYFYETLGLSNGFINILTQVFCPQKNRLSLDEFYKKVKGFERRSDRNSAVDEKAPRFFSSRIPSDSSSSKKYLRISSPIK